MPTSFCTIAFFPTPVGTVFPSSADLGVGKNRLKVPTPAHPVTALYFPCIPALYQALALYFAPQQFVQLRGQLETAVQVSISHSAILDSQLFATSSDSKLAFNFEKNPVQLPPVAIKLFH